MREKTGEELFADYLREINNISEGKYKGSEEDFVKQYAFYMTVTYPMIKEFAEAITGVKVK